MAGILCFFVLRPHIDFFASAPIAESKATVEERIQDLAPGLGFSTDSLAVVSMRKQHQSFFQEISGKKKEELSIADLNKRGVQLHSWESIIGEAAGSEGYYATTEQVFESSGRLRLLTANNGRIIRMEAHPEQPNPTFIQGDSLLTIAEYVVQHLFNYELDNYRLSEQDFSDSTDLSNLTDGQSSYQSLGEEDEIESLNIIWRKIASADSSAPDEIALSLNPVVREIDDQDGFRTEFGFSIESFVAKDDVEPVDLVTTSAGLEGENIVFVTLMFGSVFVLFTFIIIVGVRNIFKGKVEWRRALFILIATALGLYGWRTLFFIDAFQPFLSNPGIFITHINNLVFAIIGGLYASLAYICWEALARTQKQSQLDVIDALWQRKFFLSEAGAAIINGLAFGGIAIGIVTSLVFFMDQILIQTDSQFGFTEPSITFKLFSINLNAWTTTWLVTIAQIGFVYSILKHWIKKEWVVGIAAIVFSGIFMTVLGRLIGTTGSIYQDMLIYTGIAVVFVYAIREFGLLSVISGFWLFTVFFMVLPYWNSPSLDVAYVGWGQIIVVFAIVVYAVAAYRYGTTVSEVGDYIPEYEERIAQHLRVEKEIEIARESQYKLMPLQPPKADGIDVYGFFLPSFEVGGDYFDYLVTNDENGTPKALTMAVVDVSGKAMRAAMPAVFTSGLLLSRMKHDCPDEVLTEISEPIFLRTDKRTFITCVLARYELDSMKMSIANAGHCRPILKRNGIAEYIHTPEPAYPLGIKQGVKYKTEEIVLKKGDFFLLYSDGLPEAVNEKGERYGFDQVPRLIESIDTDNLTANEIAQEIKRTVQKFSNYQLADDTTIICLKV